MKTISSEVGERLARIKRELDEIKRLDQTPCEDMVWEYERAADAVADELVAQGFGNAEGD